MERDQSYSCIHLLFMGLYIYFFQTKGSEDFTGKITKWVLMLILLIDLILQLKQLMGTYISQMYLYLLKYNTLHFMIWENKIL